MAKNVNPMKDPVDENQSENKQSVESGNENSSIENAELQNALNLANDEIEKLKTALEKKTGSKTVKADITEILDELMQFSIPVRGALQNKPMVQKSWIEFCEKVAKAK